MRAGDLLVVSGQLGLSDGRLVDGGVQLQLRQALLNLATLLDTEGATLSDVVKTTLYLRHIDDYQAVNDTYLEVFSGHHLPARAAVAVAGLPMGALVEIDALAYQPHSTRPGPSR